MSEHAFNEPRIALNRIYTKVGDRGQTRLVGGQSRSKTDLRIECYGTVDELNAFVGAARLSTEDAKKDAERLGDLATTLKRVQHELFNLGSILATLPEDVHPKQPRITEAEVSRLGIGFVATRRGCYRSCGSTSYRGALFLHPP